MELTAAPNPAPARKPPRIDAAAATLHFTQAERANAIRARKTSQSSSPPSSDPKIHKLSQVQRRPARLACTRKTTKPGIHVITERKYTSRLIFPSTYSARVNGRQKYSGSALLARSGATR